MTATHVNIHDREVICFCFNNIYGMYFLFVAFLHCNLVQLTLVEGFLLPFLYIHTCVIFNKCIQTSNI